MHYAPHVALFFVQAAACQNEDKHKKRKSNHDDEALYHETGRGHFRQKKTAYIPTYVTCLGWGGYELSKGEATHPKTPSPSNPIHNIRSVDTKAVITVGTPNTKENGTPIFNRNYIPPCLYGNQKFLEQIPPVWALGPHLPNARIKQRRELQRR